MRRFGIFCLVLGAAVSLLVGTPGLAAQENGSGPGYGRRGFMMGGNGVHGVVTGISGSSLTIKDEQGQVFTIQTGPNTHIRKDRQEAKLSDIHPGDEVMAAGHLDEQTKSLGAVFLVVLTPEQAARMKQMRANFGKTWTAGQVTLIGNLKLTVERPDHVSQTIAVNESTQFHRRGPDGDEEIAFPDIKTGDRIMARGSLEGSSFVASQISVMPPHRHHGRGFGRRGQEAPPNDTPPPADGPQN